MRLTCPNCQAQYEVDESAIPEAGRDVQCSNCKKTWFQEKEGSDPAGLPRRVSKDPAVVATDQRPRSGSVEDSILGILREEAEREQRARAEDRQAANSAVAKLSRGLQAPNPELEARRTAPPDLGKRPEPEAPKPQPVQDEPARSRLTDEAQISKALAQATSELPPVEPAEDEAASGRSSFSSGFTLVIVLFGLAMVFYSFSSTIVEFVPQSEPYMTQYVAFVDQLRMAVDEQLVKLTDLIESKL